MQLKNFKTTKTTKTTKIKQKILKHINNRAKKNLFLCSENLRIRVTRNYLEKS